MRHAASKMLFLGWGAAATVLAADGPVKYPPTRRVDHLDEYHGTKVADPYRWLEEDVRESDEVAAWVEAQNEVTFSYLESIPQREAIRERLLKLWDYEKYSAPFKRGGRYYFYKNDGLQNQDVLYVMDALDAEPHVLIDPNKWSEDGTVSLAWREFSDDGKYVAYGVAEAGSDWQTWHVMEIEGGKVLDDTLKWVKYSAASWTRDGKGFFYGRFDEPEKGNEFQGLTHNQQLYYHRVGTPQSEDVLVYQRPDHPDWGFRTEVTEDGRYLVITVYKGTDAKYRVMYKDLTEPYGMPIDLIENFENEYSFVGNDGAVFFFKTDQGAPRRRLIAIDVRRPEPEHWREIVPEAQETLRGVGLVSNMFALPQGRQDASEDIHHGRTLRSRGGIPGDRLGIRLWRTPKRHGNVLRIC